MLKTFEIQAQNNPDVNTYCEFSLVLPQTLAATGRALKLLARVTLRAHSVTSQNATCCPAGCVKTHSST